MKKRFQFLTLFLAMISLSSFAQVSINNSGTDPDNSAMLDVSATDKGLLIPRVDLDDVTTADPVEDPAVGLLIFNQGGDEAEGFYYWDGEKWAGFGSSGSASANVPVGSIISYGSTAVPAGWLACDGSAVSRTAYADLFSVIGTTYGAGDGSTTFNLPDTRGIFLRGAGTHGTGAYDATLGEFQTDQFKAHNHMVDPPNTVSTTNGAHSHLVDPPNTITTTNGAHSHLVDPPNTITTTNGAHSHTTTGSAVANFGYPPMTGQLAYHGHGTTTTSVAGAHNHYVNIPAFYSASAGNHNHYVNIPSFNSSSAGAHNHYTNIPAFNSASVGGSETRPANLGVQYIIKFEADSGQTLSLDGNVLSIAGGNTIDLTEVLDDSDWTIEGANMYNANTGNVGIGTSTPAYGLDVIKPVNNNYAARIQNGGGNGYGLLIQANAATAHPLLNTMDNYGDSKFMVLGNGKVGIGTSTPAYKLHVPVGNIVSGNVSPVGSTSNTTAGAALNSTGYIWAARASTGGVYFAQLLGGVTSGILHSFYVGNSNVGSITTNGSTTSYNTTSDYRLKQDIVKLDEALDKIRSLKPSNYAYKAKPEVTESGFIAHELQEVYPQAVTGVKDAVDADGKPVYQHVDYGKLTPLLAAGIQELEMLVKKQQEMINALEAQNDALVKEFRSFLLEKGEVEAKK